MLAVLVAGATATQNSALSSYSGGRNHRQYSLRLPTEGWPQAQLAWVAGYVVRQFTCLKAVTHPSSNRAQCRATALIETNALPLH